MTDKQNKLPSKIYVLSGADGHTERVEAMRTQRSHAAGGDCMTHKLEWQWTGPADPVWRGMHPNGCVGVIEYAEPDAGKAGWYFSPHPNVTFGPETLAAVVEKLKSLKAGVFVQSGRGVS